MPGETKHGIECTEFEALLTDALEGQLSPARKESFDAHRRVCEICGPLFAEVKTGWQLLRSIYRSSSSAVERSLAMELFLAYVIVVISSMESGNITTHPMLSFLIVLGFAEFLRRRNKFRNIRLQSVPIATDKAAFS